MWAGFQGKLFGATIALFSVVWVGEQRALAQDLPAYTATAGMIEVGPNPDFPDAEMFHVDYVVEGADPLTRPVTFIFIGGPGAASIFLHVSAIGPMTIATAGDGSFPPVPPRGYGTQPPRAWKAHRPVRRLRGRTVR